MYFNPRDDYSFSLNLYPPGFHSFTITDSSLAYIYFTDDGDDIDEDKGFSGFLNEGSGGINFSVGNNFRTQAKLVQVLISSFELGLPRSVIDAMVPGGPFTVQLPSGKRYTIKLPPSAAAIAHFKKCFGG
ncbi:MAG TPA: hypothetical protein VG328_09045 [Stellaceae bacterium]|nr:hypothetical protein [Stellaceae bacterium]